MDKYFMLEQIRIRKRSLYREAHVKCVWVIRKRGGYAL